MIGVVVDRRYFHARAGAILSKQFKLFLPVQSCRQKDICSHLTQITRISLAVPSHTEGRFAIVTNAGRDAVDTGGALTKALNLRTAKSCGPDTPTLVSSWRKRFR
jgi:hypothetical protein